MYPPLMVEIKLFVLVCHCVCLLLGVCPPAGHFAGPLPGVCSGWVRRFACSRRVWGLGFLGLACNFIIIIIIIILIISFFLEVII